LGHGLAALAGSGRSVVDFVEQGECLGGAGNVAAISLRWARTWKRSGLSAMTSPGGPCKNASRRSVEDKGIIADSKRVTTVKTRIIARTSRWFASITSAASRCAAKRRKTLRLLFTALKKLDALVLSDYDKA